MIQPLRTGHRRIFMMLAILLPAIIAGGLSERHTLVSAKASSTFQGTTGLSAASAVWQKNTATTEFSSNPTSPDSVRLVLKPVKELHDPDLLLYWTAEAGSSDLSQARLLGTFAGGRVYSLTREEYRGGLVLYSLAHSAIVDRAKIEGLP